MIMLSQQDAQNPPEDHDMLGPNDNATSFTPQSYKRSSSHHDTENAFKRLKESGVDFNSAEGQQKLFTLIQNAAAPSADDDRSVHLNSEFRTNVPNPLGNA